MAAVPSRDWSETGGAARRVRGRLAPDAMFPGGMPGYRTRFVELATGERARVVEVGPEDGPPVVFVGGWACSIWDFNQTLAPVAAAGFRVLALDPRGHGLSDMPSGDALYTTDALVLHVLDTLDALGIGRAAMVGHSMGAALSVHCALRAPTRVSALVLIGAVGFGDTWPAEFGRALSPRWTLPFMRASLRRWVVAVGLRLVYGPATSVDERNIDEYWAPSQFDGFIPAMRAVLHGFRWSRFTSEELARVPVPAFVIRGGYDRVVQAPDTPLTLPPMFRELLIPEAGHLPHDEAPQRVNAAIIAFLTETSPAAR